jgi:hypothetical protein
MHVFVQSVYTMSLLAQSFVGIGTWLLGPGAGPMRRPRPGIMFHALLDELRAMCYAYMEPMDHVTLGLTCHAEHTRTMHVRRGWYLFRLAWPLGDKVLPMTLGWRTAFNAFTIGRTSIHGMGYDEPFPRGPRSVVRLITFRWVARFPHTMMHKSVAYCMHIVCRIGSTHARSHGILVPDGLRWYAMVLLFTGEPHMLAYYSSPCETALQATTVMDNVYTQIHAHPDDILFKIMEDMGFPRDRTNV